MEHGHLAHYPKLYEELVRVPLSVSHPDGESKTVERAVGLDAIPPTVCDAMGVEHDFDGESLLDGTSDSSPAPPSHVRRGSRTDRDLPTDSAPVGRRGTPRQR